MKHVLRSQQFDRPSLERLFAEVGVVAKMLQTPDGRRELRDKLTGRIMCTLFYEPSTRTRVSFETAAHRLGMDVITTENAAEFSSAAKGETLEDSIRVIAGYGTDAIVLRHKEDGASDRAAGIIDRLGLSTHVLNAGDGRGQHPTQALLDLCTIWDETHHQIDGLTVAIGGDLANGRTVRSLAYMLSRFKTKIIFVSPPELAIGEDIKLHLREHDIEFREETSLASVLSEANVFYWTRLQRERLRWMLRVKLWLRNSYKDFRIGSEQLKLMRKDAIIMHPLPRIDEIAKEVDGDPRAAYFRQAANGLFVRSALLLRLFDQTIAI
jgi:aspartate carbamoyltransferase catalytic subunit